jgi:diguanylate cyclase (GGDEF)-like protein
MMNTRELVAPAPALPFRERGGCPPSRILVIDDNEGVLECFRKVLEAQTAAPELAELEAVLFGMSCDTPMPEAAFDIDTFTDGERACRAAFGARIQTRPYAVAFVDMCMPGGWDGLQTIEELWRVDAALQVVICTAYSDHAWSDVLHRLGRADHLLILRKPFEPIEVLQLARALSQKWLLQREQEMRLADLERKVEARVGDLRRANRTLRMLSQCNEALVRATSEPELLEAVCRHIVHIGGYRLAWVGFARGDEARSVVPAAHAGSDRDYVGGLHLTWGDDEQRQGVGGAAIRDGRPMVARCIATSPAFTRWRSDTLARGLASCIALPLRSKDGVLGALSIYSEASDAFDADETKLLAELADDLSYGIASLRESEERWRIELELERQANYDALTGLANRSTLEARLQESAADAKRRGNKFALMFVDLDRFKMVNDTLGHAVGDKLLCEVARLLEDSVRESDTVARLGGDEFVVLLRDVGTMADAARVADRIIAALSAPLRIDGHQILSGASVGVSLFPDDTDDVASAMRHADLAMYHAKSLGGGTFRFFSPEMNARMAQHYAMEADLRRALENGELLVHYQPQVSLVGGAISGSEALVRWRHPVKGMVSPAEFIPLAEETGLMEPLGEWVLRDVCAQLRRWLDEGLPVVPVAVNLSARQLRQATLVSSIKEVLVAHALEPSFLKLEVTESAVMHDVDAAVATMKGLKALGVGLSLDDFGTGYSSLSYLKRFPIDDLKIDKSFVHDVTTDPDSATICNSIIGLAHSLKLRVIAEGVETEAQMQYLRQRGCDEVQGYLFSKPLPVDEFARMLGQERRLPLPDTEGTQRSILIVDDEANVRNALKRLLRRDGYKILTADSAREGLDMLARHGVQVILSDQRMPGMNGTEFLNRVKELYPQTVRIILSGYAELECVIEAINRGAIYRFFTKPWNDETLRSDIHEAFRHHELTRSAAAAKPAVA